MGKYRILALDGASITGGQGWMGVGLIRDFWERMATLTEKATQQYASTIALAEKADWSDATLFGKGVTGSGSHLDELSREQFIYLWQFYFNFVTHKADVTNLLVSLNELRSKRKKPTRPAGRGIGPLAAELGAMAMGVSLKWAGKERQDAIYNEMVGVVDSKCDNWRRFAAEKNRSVDIQHAIKAIRGGKESAAEMLLQFPAQFLMLRWVTQTRPVPNLCWHMDRARTAMRCLVRDGFIENEYFELQRIDLLAGTSSGGLNALIFAQNENLFEALDQSMKMWANLNEVLFDVMKGVKSFNCQNLSRLLGRRSLLGEAGMAIYPRYFGSENIRELDSKVAITTVQLDTGQTNSVPVLRRWKPMIFHNYNKSELRPDQNSDKSFAGIRMMPGLRDEQEVADISIRDLACATSAAPIARPVKIGKNRFPLPGVPTKSTDHYTYTSGYSGGIFISPTSSGFIDGGMYANNPALAGMVVAMELKALEGQMEQITLVSMGNGRQAMDHVEVSDGDLGFLPWLASQQRPGLLLDVMLDVGVDATNGVCETFLGERMKRYDVWTDALVDASGAAIWSAKQIELQLDENLGINRYIYHQEPGKLLEFLKTHWATGLGED